MILTQPERDYPVLIELVGLAGAGKSSLSQALGRRDARIRRNIEISRFTYLRDLPRLLPTFARFHQPFRGLRRKEMKRVLHLTTLDRLLNDGRINSGRIQVLDEGPVYMFARMLCLGEPRFENEAFHRWWDVAVAQWAQRLRLLVWLDAAPDVLVGRIRRRSGLPPISDISDSSLLPFLERYRGCYQRVMQELMAAGGPRVMAFDTGSMSVESLANQVLRAICPNSE